MQSALPKYPSYSEAQKRFKREAIWQAYKQSLCHNILEHKGSDVLVESSDKVADLKDFSLVRRKDGSIQLRRAM